MKLRTFILSMLLVAVSSAGFQAAAQVQVPVGTSVESPGGPGAGAASMSGAPARYRLGPDDEFSLTVVGEPDLTKVFRVRADGAISMPNVDDLIMAQGLTAIELQGRIADALKTTIRNPQVRVDVTKYGSQFVTVQGEVRNPQKMPMTGPMTLNDALAQAGFLTPNAGSRLMIARPNSTGAGEPERTEISMKDLQNAVPGANITLAGGDVIFVPKAEMYYVQGRVKTAGSYMWEEGLTVEQAITKAGGVDDRGRKGTYKVTRTVNGKNKTIDLKSNDLVQANDSIEVKQRMF